MEFVFTENHASHEYFGKKYVIFHQLLSFPEVK